jgi:hypothetical protein
MFDLFVWYVIMVAYLVGIVETTHKEKDYDSGETA